MARKGLVVDRPVSHQVALKNDGFDVISWLALPELLYLLLIRLPPGNPLNVPLVLSMAGSWVSGSPMRKCPRDKYVGLDGLSHKAHGVWNVERPLALTAITRCP